MKHTSPSIQSAATTISYTLHGTGAEDVIGHSMTGMATQRIAADTPSRVKSALAVCPMSAAGSQIDDAAFGFFASTTEDDDTFRRLIKFLTGRLSDQWADVKLWQNRAMVSPACRLGYLTVSARTSCAADVQGLATPYLIVVAENDPGLDEAAMKRDVTCVAFQCRTSGDSELWALSETGVSAVRYDRNRKLSAWADRLSKART